MRLNKKKNPPTGGFYIKNKWLECMRAGLFVNGDFEKTERIMNQISKLDLIVAVDGGLNHITHSGLSPDIIIGDLDSIEFDDQEYFKNLGVNIIQFPTHKDETDLELAVEHVINLGFHEILIFGATGSRVDHFLGNILQFSNPDLLKYQIKIFTKDSEIFYCNKNQTIEGSEGDTVSLIPISDVVTGIKTSGLLFALENEDLFRWKCRGLSNQMVERVVEVKFDTGVLLCVHSFNLQDQIVQENEK